MGKKRKTNSEVRQSITSALYALMREKDFNKITVTELVEHAQVARVSFYRNYSNMDDVLRQNLRQITEEWVTRIGVETFYRDSRTNVYELLKLVLDNRDLCDLIVESGRIDLLRDEFNRAFGVGCPDRRESARRAFLAGGLYNLSHRWIISGYDPDPETLADFVYEMVRSAII